MVNIKKIDDQDIVFLNTKPSPNEDEDFSNFLKSRRKKAATHSKTISIVKKQGRKKNVA
jgi:hypothetical protein